MLGLLFRIGIYRALGVERILSIRNARSGTGRVYLVRALGGLVGLEGGAGWRTRKEGARFHGVWLSARVWVWAWVVSGMMSMMEEEE